MVSNVVVALVWRLLCLLTGSLQHVPLYTVKRLHRSDLYGWSTFAPHVDIDFNSIVWVRPEGNVVIDPLPMSDHDAAHLLKLGGVAHIVLTNSRHVRDSAALAERYSAEILGPCDERDSFPIPCNRFLSEGDEPFPGLSVLALSGSKTPGELALLLDGDGTTLITGDLVRSHRAGKLQLLRPEQGLSDAKIAAQEVARLAAISHLAAVLVGDGFCEFRDAARSLAELRDALQQSP